LRAAEGLPEADSGWLARAFKKMMAFQLPYMEDISDDIQLRQLELATAHRTDALILAVEPNAPCPSFAGFSRGVLHIAEKTALQIVVYIPDAIRDNPGLAPLLARAKECAPDDHTDPPPAGAGAPDKKTRQLPPLAGGLAEQKGLRAPGAVDSDGQKAQRHSGAGAQAGQKAPRPSAAGAPRRSGQASKEAEPDCQAGSAAGRETAAGGGVKPSPIKSRAAERPAPPEGGGAPGAHEAVLPPAGAKTTERTPGEEEETEPDAEGGPAGPGQKTVRGGGQGGQGFIDFIGKPNPRSKGEKLLWRFITADPVLKPLFEFNTPVKTKSGREFVVDLVWREGRLAIEVDSYRWHTSKDAFDADRQRDYLLLLSGYRVLRLTNREIIRSIKKAGAKIHKTVNYIKRRKK
jgi:very-short-patch-repair endonuclease